MLGSRRFSVRRHAASHSLTHSLPPLPSPHLSSAQLSSAQLISSHHSPLFTTPLVTSHSSFTTLHITTYHISLIIHHSTHPLSTSHPSFTTLHISLITSHSSFNTFHHTTSHYISCQASCSDEWLPFAWQGQYTEPPGGAAVRVGAAGAAAAFCVAGAVHRAAWRSSHSPLITSHSSLLTYHISLITSHLPFSHLTHHFSQHHFSLPIFHISLITSHLPHLTHHFSLTISHFTHHLSHLTHHAPRAALPTYNISLITSHSHISLLTSPFPFSHPAHLSQLHFSHLTYHILPSHSPPITSHSSPLITTPLLTTSHYGSLSQAQYKEPPGGAAFCVAGAVHRASWWSCGARGCRWGRDCLLCGRRSTQSLLELQRAWAPLGPRLPFVWQAQYTEPLGGALTPR